MEAQEAGSSNRSIFISHRHKDKAIADVFRQAFEDWSNEEVAVFQSSNTDTAPCIGDELNESINEAIGNANVVLLIYTSPADDWAWCMYECGLAQDPTSMDTRIVVFHTTEEVPGPLQHLITVPLSKNPIEILVDDFHRDANFFPHHHEAFAPSLSEDKIEQRSDELYEALLKVVPDTKVIETLRFDHIMLALDLKHVREVQRKVQETNYRGARAYAKELITAHCMVTELSSASAAPFNFEDRTKDLKLSDLVERWRKETDYPYLPWDDELYEEMTRAMLNRKEGVLSVPFNSVEPDSNAWFLPIIHRTRLAPDEGIMEFEILLCGIRSTAAQPIAEQRRIQQAA